MSPKSSTVKKALDCQCRPQTYLTVMTEIYQKDKFAFEGMLPFGFLLPMDVRGKKDLSGWE